MATTDVAAQGSTQLDPDFVDDFVRRFYEAWNALDADAVADLCTDDIVWDEPIIPEAAVGKDQVRRFVNATKKVTPDFHIEKLSPQPYISTTEPKVLQPYRMTGTNTGVWDYTGLLPTGYRIDSPAVDEWTFRGELLCHYVTYYDTLDFCRQIGNMPPWGYLGENGEKLGHWGDRMLTSITNISTRINRLRGGPKTPFPPGFKLRR